MKANVRMTSKSSQSSWSLFQEKPKSISYIIQQTRTYLQEKPKRTE